MIIIDNNLRASCPSGDIGRSHAQAASGKRRETREREPPTTRGLATCTRFLSESIEIESLFAGYRHHNHAHQHDIYCYSKTNNKPTLILLPAWVYFLVARWYDLCWIQQSAILSSNLFRSSGSEPLGSVIFSANSSVMITLWAMHRSKASEN